VETAEDPGQAPRSVGTLDDSTSPRQRSRLIVPALVATVILLLAGVLILTIGRHRSPAIAELRTTGIPSSVSTALANQMLLSPVPPKRAPGFTLVDQNGRSISLSSFRGRVVVLEFMDPHCTDFCPIVSEEFLKADRDLGAEASQVVFVAVNVNQYHAGVADMMAFSKEEGLTGLPSWHFLTGPVPRLRKVWQDYGVEVQAPSPNADIIHTSIVYFIDKKGVERYIGSPMDDHTAKGTAYLPANQLEAWGQGIALVAEDLAP
jgi:cytochrome oxidase Cu insertion factor (SCO1/SenC/PrrC family)